MPANHTLMDESNNNSSYSYLFGRFRLQIVKTGESIDAALFHAALFSDGHPVALSTAELTVLRMLIENQGQFVTTKDLLRSVSRSPNALDNLVHGAVRELRRTLHDADLIISVRSKGYVFTGQVELRPDEGPGALADVSPNVVSDVPPDMVLEVSSQVAPIAPVNNQTAVATLDRRRDPFVVVAILVSAAVVLLTFGLALADWDLKNVTKQVGFIQALMILVAIGYDFFSFSENRDSQHEETERHRARIAVQQLRRSWRLLLAAWCCLYFILFWLRFAPLPGEAPSAQWQALQVIATFLNNASALMLVLCYVVLNRPTVIKVAERDVEDLPLKPGLLLIGGFGLLEAILVALCGYFEIPGYARGVIFGADLVSGVVGGIAMALYISRLDSRLLGTSGLLPVVPIVLYFYAVIQPFYPLLNSTIPSQLGLPQHFDLWIMQLAFVLKSVMYIYVTELFRKERFLFYMVHARRVYENVDSEWTGFKSARNS